jgi:hypothetical protein
MADCGWKAAMAALHGSPGESSNERGSDFETSRLCGKMNKRWQVNCVRSGTISPKDRFKFSVSAQLISDA